MNLTKTQTPLRLCIVIFVPWWETRQNMHDITLFMLPE
jgi:hypothetical protein